MPAAIVAVAAGAAGAAATGLFVAGSIAGMVAGAIASTVVAGVLSKALTPSAQQQQTAEQAAAGVQVNTERQSAPLYTVYGETRIGGTLIVVGTSNSYKEHRTVSGTNNPELLTYLVRESPRTTVDEGGIIDPTSTWSLTQDSPLFTQLKPEAQNQAINSSNGALRFNWADRATLFNAGSEVLTQPTVVVTQSVDIPNGYLHLVVAHCEGGVNGATMLYLGDTPYTDKKYAGLVHWEFFTGADDQAACATLVAANVSGWNATHRLRGICYSYVRLLYKADTFNGIPQITVKLKGRNVYDPRNGTTAWSSNPALCIQDYLTNARFGRGIPAALIDNASFIAAANACDSTYVGTSGGARKLHTCNGVTNPDTSTLENVRAMLTACRGRLVYSARGYSLVIDKARASTFAFTPDNITGSWQITLPGKRTMRNKMIGAWVNPDDLYKEDLYPVDSTAYRVLDNGVMLENRIELPFTQNVHEAQMLCERELRQSRIGMQVSFRAFISAITCEVGDVVTITHPTPGWTNKPFDVTRIVLLSDDEVQVDCREYDAVIYDPHVLTAPRTTYVTQLPDPQIVPSFASLTLASGTDILQIMPDGTIVSRIKITWAKPNNIFLDDGQVEVQFKPATDTNWMSLLSHASTGELFIAPVRDGIAYDVRARWVNEFKRRGAWQAATHLVIGKTAPPANVVEFTASVGGDRIVLNWRSVEDVDLSEYEIREGESWETATLVGKVKATTIKVIANFYGSKTWLIKAVDTTGHYSLMAATTRIAVIAPPAPPLRQQVIDNNVLLFWSEVAGTLPTATYEIRKGAAWATSENIGRKSGAFTTIFEIVAGTYTYWLAAVDIAGNIGTPSSVTASVSQPPDYIFYTKFSSVWAGSKVNCSATSNGLILPINTSETWSGHFASNGWATIQNQIEAGYPYYLQPVPTSAKYTEIIDYGAILPSFKASVLLDVTHIVAGITLAISLSTSLDGVTYSTPIAGNSAFFTNFRYLKVVLTATGIDNKNHCRINALTVQLDVKRSVWAGSATCNADDIGGTTVYLTKDGTPTGIPVFIDITGITIGVNTVSNISPVYDFVDTPYPTQFKILLFNAANGTRASGAASYTATGVLNNG